MVQLRTSYLFWALGQPFYRRILAMITEEILSQLRNQVNYVEKYTNSLHKDPDNWLDLPAVKRIQLFRKFEEIMLDETEEK